MNKMVLLLNSSYQPISFITTQRAIKLLFKEKATIISSWDEVIRWGNSYDEINIPSVLKLNYYVRWIPTRARYSDKGIFNRDNNTCQYCGIFVKRKNLTIDHIIPKSKGGVKSWENCVASCKRCNGRKGSKSLVEANMSILNKPTIPRNSLVSRLWEIRNHHSDWKMYLR